MNDIVAVLVVPADGDPGGLLADGRASNRPPAFVGLGWPREVVGWTLPEQASGWCQVALPLWWDGALVPEGWDRVRRVLHIWRGGELTDLDYNPRPRPPRLPDDIQVDVVLFSPAVERVLRVAEFLVQVGLASRVVRLARVDGRLVEVQP